MSQKNIYAGTMDRLEFEERVKTAKCVIIPVGSCEQHGYHLPLDTDNIVGTMIGERAALETDSILMPSINYGQVWSARKFSGSVSLSNDTVKMLVSDIVHSLRTFGVKNILFLTGHNGNATAVKEIARDLYSKEGIRNVWYWSPYADKSVLSILDEMPPSGVFHAGEMETSMMLSLRPDLVNLEKAKAEYPKAPARAKYQPVGWEEYVTVGCFGDPARATKEKGDFIIDACVKDLVHVINDLMEG